MYTRYQVFLSSTYTDLREERLALYQALMKLDCIPAGMELFPATDDEQFAYIKRIIDQSDYYVLVIGARYGTLSESGISYTEKEYDYAVSKKVKILSFIHEQPEKISYEKNEADPQRREQLEKFRQKVSSGRLVDYWLDMNDLTTKVVTGISQITRTQPAIGWVRANAISSESARLELSELKAANAELQLTLSKQAQQQAVLNLVEMNSEFKVGITYRKYAQYGGSTNERVERSLTWNNIFSNVGGIIVSGGAGSQLNQLLAKRLAGFYADSISVEDHTFETIGFQLSAYGLIEIRQQSKWSLTKAGEQLLLQLRTIQKAPENSGAS